MNREYHKRKIEFIDSVITFNDEKIIDRTSAVSTSLYSIGNMSLILKSDYHLYKRYKSLGLAIKSMQYDVENQHYGDYQPFNWNVIVSDGLYIQNWMKKTKAEILYPNNVIRYLSICFHDLYRRDMEPVKEIIPIIENLVNTKRSEAKEAGRLLMLKGIVEGDEKLFKEGADFSVKKRKRLFTPDEGIDHCVDIIGMLKLAHYNGLDFEYESDYVPQELVDYTPIDISDDPVFLRVKEAYRNEHPEIQAVWDEMEK